MQSELREDAPHLLDLRLLAVLVANLPEQDLLADLIEERALVELLPPVGHVVKDLVDVGLVYHPWQELVRQPAVVLDLEDVCESSETVQENQAAVPLRHALPLLPDDTLSGEVLFVCSSDND